MANYKRKLLIAPIWNRNIAFFMVGCVLIILLIAPIWNRNGSTLQGARVTVQLLIAPIWNRNSRNTRKAVPS